MSDSRFNDEGELLMDDVTVDGYHEMYDKMQALEKENDNLRLREIKDPILGQEAICGDGLGRVKEWGYPVTGTANGWGWARVDTYINNRGCKWDRHNVELIDPRGEK